MTNKLPEFYEVEDFLTDESFTNYHFQLNAKDELSWKEWLANHPEKNELVTEARELIQTLSLTISDDEYKNELKKIRGFINEKQPQNRVRFLNWNKNLTRGRRTKRVLQYLLPALLIFIAGGYFLLRSTNQNSTGLLVMTNNQNKNLVITLSDSTVVTLAPKSVLHYPSHFQQQQRNVYLEGDAQFHVKRNEQAPFKVYSGNIVATVLGTIFNFKKSGDSLTVELISGKLNVALNDQSLSKSLLLSPAEKAIFVKHDHAFYKVANKPHRDLQFHQNNFNEIAIKIKSAFGVTVINNSNKKDWRFTADFNNTTAQDIVENICIIKNLKSQVVGDTIFINN